MTSLRIYLTGFMAAGKTTVGRALACRLGVSFIDLDDTIERLSGLTVPEIFERHGESRFRKLETEALRLTREQPGVVVATGGGIVTRAENRELMRQAGHVVWLNADFDTMVQRMEGQQGGTRPLFEERGRAAILFGQRLPLYRQCDIEIAVGPDEVPEETVRRILSLLSPRPCVT
jgi:shikimate kinase